MPLSDLPVHVFGLIGDLYRDPVRRPLRSRGPRTTAPTDPEVIAVGRAGGFLGLDRDKGAFAPSRRHDHPEFPGLMRVHRTTLARRAADPLAVTRAPHEHPAARAADREPVWLVDRRPAGRGGPVRPGRVPPPAEGGGAVGAGDRSDWPPPARGERAAGGVAPPAPLESRSRGPGRRRSRRRARVRRVIGTAPGPLAGRSHIERTWARDLWHLSRRVTREVVGHTVAVWVAPWPGRPPSGCDGRAG